MTITLGIDQLLQPLFTSVHCSQFDVHSLTRKFFVYLDQILAIQFLLAGIRDLGDQTTVLSNRKCYYNLAALSAVFDRVHHQIIQTVLIECPVAVERLAVA